MTKDRYPLALGQLSKFPCDMALSDYEKLAHILPIIWIKSGDACTTPLHRNGAFGV